MKNYFVILATLIATQANAEIQIAAGEMRAIYDGNGKQRLACFDVKNSAGMNAPIMIMITSEITVKGELHVSRTYGGIVSSGDCIAVRGPDRLLVEGAAITEPVTVLVGASRNALKLN